MPHERRMVDAQVRKSSSDGSRTASRTARTFTRSSWPACVRNSQPANRPIMTGMKWMPSDSSQNPKVKRSTPVVKSMPTVASSTPNAPPIRFLTADSPLIVASIDSPNSASAKYSGGPKS